MNFQWHNSWQELFSHQQEYSCLLWCSLIVGCGLQVVSVSVPGGAWGWWLWVYVAVGGRCGWWLWLEAEMVAVAMHDSYGCGVGWVGGKWRDSCSIASAMVVTVGPVASVADPGWILDPGSRGQKGTGSRIRNTAGSGCGRFQLVTDLVGLRSCPVMLSDMSIMMNRCRIIPSFVFPDNKWIN